MKFLLRFTLLSLFVVSFFLITENAQAHPGNTDNSGGHTCRTNCSRWGLSYGEYHYHNSGNNNYDSDFYWQFQAALCKNRLEDAQNQESRKKFLEAFVVIGDDCFNSEGLRLKAQFEEELEQLREEETRLRLKKERELIISNGIVFLMLLYLLFLFKKYKEDFLLFIGVMIRSGGWLLLPIVFLLDRLYPSNLDWNGIGRARLALLLISCLILLRSLEEKYNLLNTSIKFRKKVIDIIKNGYSSLLRIAEITKINKLLKLIGKLLKFYGNIVATLFGFIALCIAIFVPASIYGAIGAFIFYFIAILLIDVLSLDVELVLSRMFEDIDVAGLNELATLLFGISGFIIGVVFFLIKNRQYIKDNYISEFKINYF